MIDPATIFQRTHAGRDEIYQKSGGLTQSERLVLIMVDGTTSYQGVRSKLPVLVEERFGRAFQTLLKKELVSEVFMPLENQAADELEKTVIDRFLQQDPLDPVTIILTDPEELLGLIATPPPARRDPTPIVSAAVIPQAMASIQVAAPEQAVDAGHTAEELEELAEVVEKEVRARQSERLARDAVVPPISHAHREPPVRQVVQVAAAGHFHWGYLLIGIGLAFILGFILGRMAH